MREPWLSLNLDSSGFSRSVPLSQNGTLKSSLHSSACLGGLRDPSAPGLAILEQHPLEDKGHPSASAGFDTAERSHSAPLKSLVVPPPEAAYVQDLFQVWGHCWEGSGAGDREAVSASLCWRFVTGDAFSERHLPTIL